MESPRKNIYWIGSLLFGLAFLASMIFLGAKLPAMEAYLTLPLYLALFVLFFLLYFTSWHLRFARQPAGVRFLLTLVLVAPALALSIWLGLIRRDPVSPLVWLAPFLGIGAGLNLRIALRRVR